MSRQDHSFVAPTMLNRYTDNLLEGMLNIERKHYHSTYKVPQGKLLKISLLYEQPSRTIHHVRITGDFFAYPEEAVELLEQALDQTLLERDHLMTTIQAVIQEQKIQFIGVDPEGLTQAILNCAP